METSIQTPRNINNVENPSSQFNQDNKPSTRGGFPSRGRGRGRGLRKFKIMIQEIHTFTIDIMGGIIVPKLAQKLKRM
jgi:hypothetical protein